VEIPAVLKTLEHTYIRKLWLKSCYLQSTEEVVPRKDSGDGVVSNHNLRTVQ